MKTLSTNAELLDRSTRLTQSFYRRLVNLPFIPARRKYNLTISHERKFVWFRVAKNGSRTIFNHLKSAGLPLDLEHPYNVRYAPVAYHDYFKFAFVRNPWDRLVSCWTNKILGSKGINFQMSEPEVRHMERFENFVDYVAAQDVLTCNFHLRAQHALIDLENLDYLGRLENFADDFRHVCQTLEVPCQTIVSKNVTKRNPYQEYYTDALAERVGQIYRKDVQIFGYKF